MLQGKFIKNFAVYFSGAMVVAFFNYLFYPVLGRVLPLSSFGEVQALVALIAQLGVVFGALSVVVVHIVARPGTDADKAAMISTLRKIVFVTVCTGSVLIALLRVPLATFFHFESSLPFVALALLLFAQTLPLFRNAYLQGTKQFMYGSISSSIVAAGRIAAALLFIALGWGVFGAIVGIACANIVAWLYVTRVTKSVSLLNTPRESFLAHAKGALARELRYGILALVANVSITILYTSDVLFVKHYFDAQTAGLYAAVAAVSSIVYFALSSLSAVLLPSVAGEADLRHNTMRTALLVYAALAIPLIAIFVLFHTLIITILFGVRFAPLSYVLPVTATSAALVALATLFNSYFLALRRAALAVILPAGVVLLTVLNFLRHSAIEAIVSNFLITATFVVVALGALYLKDYLNH